jgi:GNAT superfamily N-acetyltransferase
VSVDIVDISDATFDHRPNEHEVGCLRCPYWELPDRTQWPPTAADREALKSEWFRRVSADFGVCGRLAFVESIPVAYSQFAPPRHLPTAADYECGPPTEDAVLVACLYVWRHQRRGVGSLLLRSILEDVRAHGLMAVETFARKSAANNPTGPLGFWLRRGFEIVREDEDFALVRRAL